MRRSHPRPIPPGPRVLVLNQAAGGLTYDLCRGLIEAGATVHLLTGHATIDPGISGMTLHQAPAYRRGSLAQRLVTWLRFSLTALWWCRQLEADFVVAYTNPPFLPWVAWWHGQRRGTPYVVVVYDLYPDAWIRAGGPLVASALRPVAALWRLLNRRAFASARDVVVLGEAMRDAVMAQIASLDRQRSRCIVAPPWPEPSPTLVAAPRAPGADLTVLFSGNQGWSHDPETLARLTDWVAGQNGITLKLVGGSNPGGTTSPRVVRLPRLADPEYATLLGSCDIGLVLLAEGRGRLMVPSRGFSYLAAGLPILFLGESECELARVIERYGSGWVVPAGDVISARRVLERLRRDPAAVSAARQATLGARAEGVGHQTLGRALMTGFALANVSTAR